MNTPSRRRILTAAVGGGAAWGTLSWGRAGRCHAASEAGAADRGTTGSPLVRTTRALGTDVAVTVIHADATRAGRAVDAAFDELRHVEALLSIYRPDSQVSRLNRDGAIFDAHPHLQTVLKAALDMSRRSGGAFDVTVQPLWKAHAAALRERRRPDDGEVAAARQKVDWRKLHAAGTTVRLGRSGMAVTLNGIAQGYATDRVVAVLEAHGIRQALVDVGELGSLGDKADGSPWKAGIQHPRQADAYVAVARLDGRCLATSGDYATAFDEDRSSHHIFDPSTGRSPVEFSSVSVVAPTAMEADALSTAVFVLGLERGGAARRGNEGGGRPVRAEGWVGAGHGGIPAGRLTAGRGRGENTHERSSLSKPISGPSLARGRAGRRPGGGAFRGGPGRQRPRRYRGVGVRRGHRGQDHVAR